MGRETIGICSARPPWRIVLYYFSVLAALLESITSPPLQPPFFFFFSFLFFSSFSSCTSFIPTSFFLVSSVQRSRYFSNNAQWRETVRFFSHPHTIYQKFIIPFVIIYLLEYALSLCIICDIIRNKDKKILFIKKGGAIR